VSVKHPNEIMVGLNNRDPKWHDAWVIDIRTGKGRMVFKNEAGYGGFVADDDFNIRYAMKDTPDGGFNWVRIGADGKATDYMTIPGDDSLTTTIAGFDTAGTTLYGFESRGRDKSALVTFDPTTGKPTVIGESGKADVSALIAHPVTGKVLGYGANFLKTTWTAIDPSIKGDLDFLNANVKGEWEITSQTDDGKTWLVFVDPVTEPAYYALYNRQARAVTKLFTIRPKLEGAPLSPMYPVVIKSRDGMELVSYLTLPRGSDANNDGKPDKALPMVLYVHGGPWARDEYGYNPTHQWLANRGYAVLSVNYRGSTGFGKGFTNAGDRQWGRKMHDDLIDAVEWAVKGGIAPRDKIAIMGGSYGGYATLAGVTLTPTTFACGVDIVGPSNLQTLLSTIPPYWASFFENFARRVGDPRTEEGRALLRERSPLTYADKIVRPLLIGQGANDPRVKQAESDQIVTAMKARNIPVTYVLYPDEGHGFAEPANRTSFYAVSEGFLSQCLGGRFEPVGTDFNGSSIQVKEGVGNVRGLEEALAARATH
jgi:dipeptidyl aminopeptidase/acylaminoacyl peptidase